MTRLTLPTQMGVIEPIRRAKLSPRGVASFVWSLHEQPYDFARYTPYALQSIFSQAGFDSVDVKKSGNDIEVLGQLAVLIVRDRILSHLPKKFRLQQAATILLCSTITPIAIVLICCFEIFAMTLNINLLKF